MKNKYNLQSSDFPVAEEIYSNVVSIPLFTAMSEDDQNRVIKEIHHLLNKP